MPTLHSAPVPDKYETILALLIENRSLYQRSSRVQKILQERSSWQQRVLTSQASLIAKLKFCDGTERFKEFSSRKIMEYSHNEAGYKETTQGQFISYKHAERLQE